MSTEPKTNVAAEPAVTSAENVAPASPSAASPEEVAPPPAAEDTTLEPDDLENIENDSTYGESLNSSSSTSLSSSILNHTYENGRRYHAYKDGAYPIPNDEIEQDRLDLLHHIWKLILNGELYAAPLPPNPQRVLDFGTGTGIWAIDFADDHPSATVIGTDLSPIQPSWVPPTCQFYVDDSDGPWTFQPHEKFDFIHGRAMGGSIRDWEALYGEIYKHLKPGGWVEIQEYDTWIQPNEEKVETPANLLTWLIEVNKASEKFGKKLRVAREHKGNMEAAGFVDVVDKQIKVPVGSWPKDPKQKEIGRYEQAHMIDAIEPFALALLTRISGWSVAQVQLLAAGVRKDFLNPHVHLFSYFHCVYGRKPETEKS